jgi:site-specific recombinase XerD
METAAYRGALVEADFKRSTIAIKLAAVHWLYEAVVWRGLRADNPAERQDYQG